MQTESTSNAATPDLHAEEAAAEQAFMAGFASQRGEEPPAPIATPAPQEAASDKDATPPKEQVTEQTPAPKADPLEGVRKTLDAIATKVASLDEIRQRLHSVEGRAGAALNGLTQLKAGIDAARAASAAGAPAPTQGQIQAAQDSREELKKLREDFPEWGRAADEQERALIAQFRAELEQRLSRAPQGLTQEQANAMVQAATQAAVRASQEQLFAERKERVEERHPKWEETVNTPEFRAWMEGQPQDVKGLANSDRVSDAVRMLDLYGTHAKAQAEKQKTAQQKKARLESAVQPQGTRAPVRNVESEEDGFLAGFAAVRGR